MTVHDGMDNCGCVSKIIADERCSSHLIDMLPIYHPASASTVPHEEAHRDPQLLMPKPAWGKREVVVRMWLVKLEIRTMGVSRVGRGARVSQSASLAFEPIFMMAPPLNSKSSL